MTFPSGDADTPIYRLEDSAYYLQNSDTMLGSGRRDPESTDRHLTHLSRPVGDLRSLPTLILPDERKNVDRPREQTTPRTTILGRELTPGEYESHQRIAMLARRAASQTYSPEDDARYLLATERLRRLVPRVTAEEMERLAQIAVETRKVMDENAELRRELGLDE